MRPGVPGRCAAAALATAGLLLAGLFAAPAAAGEPGGKDAAGAEASADREGIRDLLRAGRKPAAFEAARKAVEVHPADIETHVLYQEAARGQIPPAALLAEYRDRAAKSPGGESAFLLARLLPPAEAEKVLRDALKADARSYWPLVGLSTLMARLGKDAAAETAALDSLALRPGDASAAVRAGSQCAAARRYASAETCYRKAVEASPGDIGARAGLAHSLLRLGRVEEAAALSETLAADHRAEPRVHFLAAAVAMERGDLATAERSLVQVVTIAPGDMDAVFQLALLRLRRAEEKARTAPPEKDGAGGKATEPGTVDPKAIAAEMADLARAAAALPERADVRYAQGFGHEISGNAEEALAAYREAARLDPLDPTIFTALGALLLAQGHVEDGLREIQRALDREPRNTEALFHLGYGLDLQGKPKEAADAYEKLLKIDKADARAWHALGLALDGAGKASPAVKALQEAADLAPGVARYQRDLGEALFAYRRYDKAEDALEKAVALDPSDPLAWTGLARTRTPQRKYAAAVEAYEKAAALRPADKELQLLLGAYCQEYLQQYEKALIHYHKYQALGGDADDVADWIEECETEVEKRK